MENTGTILISAVLLVIVASVVVSMVRDKKKGKNSCGCHCAHCAMNGTCHSGKQFSNTH